MFFVAGGLVIASSCSSNPEQASIQLNHVDFTREDELLLARWVDAIIPKSDTPGGVDLNLHLFVMKMVDDCTSPTDQEAFVAGLKRSRKVKDAEAEQMIAYFADLSEDDVFGRILKARTVQGYVQSEYVMTTKLVYELVPGRYNGAVKIEA